MTLIPTNWRKLNSQGIEDYKGKICNQGNIYIQGQTEGETYKCSYCGSKEIRYFGSIHIGGGVGSSFYLACEKCKRDGDKMYEKEAKLPLGIRMGEKPWDWSSR